MNLKALQMKSDTNSSGKEIGIDDGEDDFKELIQDLKEEGLGGPVQPTLPNILVTVWQKTQSYEKEKDKTKICTRSENSSSVVVKKFNKEIWNAHLTSRNRAKDLRFQKIQTAYNSTQVYNK